MRLQESEMQLSHLLISKVDGNLLEGEKLFSYINIMHMQLILYPSIVHGVK